MPKRNTNGEWSRLYNEKLYSSNIVRGIKSTKLRWEDILAGMEEGRRAFKTLTAKPTVKRPLGRPRRRREDNF